MFFEVERFLIKVLELIKELTALKKFLISGHVEDYRIKVNIFAMSPNTAIKIFKQKYPKSNDIYVIQGVFKR